MRGKSPQRGKMLFICADTLGNPPHGGNTTRFGFDAVGHPTRGNTAKRIEKYGKIPRRGTQSLCVLCGVLARKIPLMRGTHFSLIALVRNPHKGGKIQVIVINIDIGQKIPLGKKEILYSTVKEPEFLPTLTTHFRRDL